MQSTILRAKLKGKKIVLTKTTATRSVKPVVKEPEPISHFEMVIQNFRKKNQRTYG